MFYGAVKHSILMESILPIFIVLAAALFVLQDFKRLIRKRNSLHEIEKNLKPIHVEYCGGRFGWTNLTFPFVRLAIYNDFIVISYVNKIHLLLSEINRLEVKRHLFSKGLHIYHTRRDAPQDIIIWSTNCDGIKKLIESRIQS